MRFLLSVLLAAWCSLALSQSYPSKPIRVVVPLVPGGNQDIVARAVGEELSKALGQQVIVENRPGIGAIVGTQAVKNSPPDGYTLLSVAVTFARVPGIMASAGYDPRTDFTGVSLVCRIPQLLVVNSSFEARSVSDLIAFARANPGKVSYGSSGNGSTGHVASELFMRMTGTKLLHVMYKGNAQALIDVMGSQITMMFDQVSTSAGHVRGGKLRALAVTTLERSPLFPEVPTLDESGLKGYEDVTWNGIVAPAGVPREIVSRLNNEVRKIMANPEFVKRYSERGIEMKASASPEEFTAYIRSEADAFAKLVKDAGMKAE
ncbi:MAG TPA: tripartite tricarboxylate transporter substrate binding protein [Burkholderiales bacterium]|nr:tripartite tricarboxylate transporter substrate binding protein [Burkholderiales bacterium]